MYLVAEDLETLILNVGSFIRDFEKAENYTVNDLLRYNEYLQKINERR